MRTDTEKAAAQLEREVREIVAPFKRGPDGDSTFAANGEPFVLFTSNGMTVEGARREWHGSPFEAVEAYLVHLRAYADRHAAGDTLYWRHRPEIERAHRCAKWSVYSRLVIGAAPPEKGDRMTAKIVRLDGSPEPADRSTDAKVALHALLEKLESGELGPLENWFFLFETESARDPANVTVHTRDNGLTISQAVWMLENAKLELMLAGRSP